MLEFRTHDLPHGELSESQILLLGRFFKVTDAAHTACMQKRSPCSRVCTAPPKTRRSPKTSEAYVQVDDVDHLTSMTQSRHLVSGISRGSKITWPGIEQETRRGGPSADYEYLQSNMLLF